MFRFPAWALAVPVLLAAAPAADPTPTASPDPVAARAFAAARQAWDLEPSVPFLRYGALIRYLHSGNHVVDTWWDASYRTRDGALVLTRMHDADAENRRLRGVPFSIFGLKIFDTNADAEPIRVDEPRISPVSTFGIVGRGGPAPTPVPGASATPLPSPIDLREIGRVEANARNYVVVVVGTETIAGRAALHLRLTPVRDPDVNRLRDLWLDPTTDRTIQLDVQGILDGKPYDGIRWTVRYVQLDGRNYVQQVVADEPLRYGIDTVIPKFEMDFVDYEFPATVPSQVFDPSLFPHVKDE